jgi:glycosyltransferase involved in cell wall biosynthesis
MHKKITLTVTNDLVFDQRMARICESLTNAGYLVRLIGRKHKNSSPLLEKKYIQNRFSCWFTMGKLFYLEYTIKLFFYLLFTKKSHAYCAIDLDTIVPIYYISKIKNAHQVYDAHELFCEMEEIVRRPYIYKIWKKIESTYVPKFKNGYTIGTMYAQEFEKLYKVKYSIVRNATLLQNENPKQKNPENYILYQGAVNEGRGFETLIPAIIQVDAKLVICGNGNCFEKVKTLIKQHNLQDKIILKGYIEPRNLKVFTANAYIGLTLFSNMGRSNYLSLANRFFDYMHSNIPQIAMNYPEYNIINSEFNIALLLDNVETQTIADGINQLLNNKPMYDSLVQNTIECKKKYCWQQEEKTLIHFYKNILG